MSVSVTIKSVEERSLCARKGVKAGWELVSVNGEEINDVLDYQFYIKSEHLILALINTSGKAKRVKIKKKENEDLGLEFETYLMDKEERCANKCIFCFIDQIPPGMRKSLYFKDDDSRLSFLFGNYITLTNLKESEVERIIKMHISPVNVSVHTMNPELRVSMMKNRFAGASLDYLRRFAEAGIKLNAQLVLCPGINDGSELEFSLDRLSKLFPALQSVACVPVGLTRFRENLPALRLYSKEEAREVIRIVDGFAESFKSEHETRLVYCADEFYISAGLPFPGEDYYEDYTQIENGVGLCVSFESEFESALEDTETDLSGGVLSIATGVAAFPLIQRLAEKAKTVFPNKIINVYEIKNDFFGHSITVAGLITGSDLVKSLKGRELGKVLLLPSVMLRADEDVFLDDLSVAELQNELGVEVKTVSNDGFEFYEAIKSIQDQGGEK